MGYDTRTHYVGDGCDPPHVNTGTGIYTVHAFEPTFVPSGLCRICNSSPGSEAHAVRAQKHTLSPLPLWVRSTDPDYRLRHGVWLAVAGFMQHPESGHWCVEVVGGDGWRDSVPLVECGHKLEWSEGPR